MDYEFKCLNCGHLFTDKDIGEDGLCPSCGSADFLQLEPYEPKQHESLEDELED